MLFSGRETTPPPPTLTKIPRSAHGDYAFYQRSPAISRCAFIDVYVFCVRRPKTYSSISGFRGHLNKKMPCNGVNIRSSMQENLSLGPRVRTAKALTGAGRSAPLLFAFWKASYLNLLQVKFYNVHASKLIWILIRPCLSH